MKYLIFTCFTFFILLAQLQAGENHHADYPLDKSVTLKCEFHVSMTQNFPTGHSDIEGIQTLIASFFFKSPQHLYFTLVDLNTEMKINEKKSSYTLNDTSNSVMGQLVHLKNRPIEIVIDKDGHLSVTNKEDARILSQFPVLSDFNEEAFLDTLLWPVLILYQKNVWIGEKLNHTPYEITITEATNEFLTGDITGKISPLDKPLISLQEGALKNTPGVALHLESHAIGHAKWMRSNGLQMQFEMQQDYKGVLKFDEWEWPMTAKLHTTIQPQ